MMSGYFDEVLVVCENGVVAGRINQKARTRTAIVDAARALVNDGTEITMLAVARAALVSEATAYRYFPDLASVLREAVAGTWPSPTEALAPVAHLDDPVERIAFATDFLLRRTLAHQSAARAMIAASITRPQVAAVRPVNRFGLIDEALTTIRAMDPERLAQLKLDLAVIVSAEALFTLTDLCGLSPDAAIASAVHTARAVTATALRPPNAPDARL
jgi:AcrR family transcriptional regulator